MDEATRQALDELCEEVDEVFAAGEYERAAKMYARLAGVMRRHGMTGEPLAAVHEYRRLSSWMARRRRGPWGEA